MTEPLTDPVVLVGDGPFDEGTCVRWFHTAPAAERNHPVLTANRRGVIVGGYLTDVPPGWVDAAVRAHQRLVADPAADMTPLATHRHRGASNGPLEPVPPVE